METARKFRRFQKYLGFYSEAGVYLVFAMLSVWQRSWICARLSYMSANHKKFVLFIEDAISDNVHLSQMVKDISPGIAIVKVTAGREAAHFLRNTKDNRIVPNLIILGTLENSGALILKEIENDPILKSVPVIILQAAATSNRQDSSSEIRLVANPEDFDVIKEAIKKAFTGDEDEFRRQGG